MSIRASCSCLFINADGGTSPSSSANATLSGELTSTECLSRRSWSCWPLKVWRLGSPTQIPTSCLSRFPLPGSCSATRLASGFRSPINLELDGWSTGRALCCRSSFEFVESSTATDGVSGLYVLPGVVEVVRASTWWVSDSRPCVHRFYHCSNISIIERKDSERLDVPFFFCKSRMHLEEPFFCDCSDRHL